MKSIKKWIIRWAVKQIKELNSNKAQLSYEDLEDYGVADILVNEHTKERAYYFN